MLEPLGDDPEGERLHARDRFVTVNGIAHDARQVSYFRQPTAVVLALQLDCEGHVINVPSVPAASQALWPTPRTFVVEPVVPRLVGSPR